MNQSHDNRHQQHDERHRARFLAAQARKAEAASAKRLRKAQPGGLPGKAKIQVRGKNLPLH